MLDLPTYPQTSNFNEIAIWYLYYGMNKLRQKQVKNISDLHVLT